MIAPHAQAEDAAAQPGAADADESQVLVRRGATAIIPQELISDGEVVILALKPSRWFILLVSLRWLAVAAFAVVAAQLLADRFIGDAIAARAQQVAVLAAAVRLLIGALQWLGRVYVLTDRRVMRLRGVLRIDLFQCELSRIQQTELTLPLAERVLFCGTVMFYTAGTDLPDAMWLTVARPAQVYETIIDTLERYRNAGRGV